MSTFGFGKTRSQSSLQDAKAWSRLTGFLQSDIGKLCVDGKPVYVVEAPTSDGTRYPHLKVTHFNG